MEIGVVKFMVRSKKESVIDVLVEIR